MKLVKINVLIILKPKTPLLFTPLKVAVADAQRLSTTQHRSVAYMQWTNSHELKKLWGQGELVHPPRFGWRFFPSTISYLREFIRGNRK